MVKDWDLVVHGGAVLPQKLDKEVLSFLSLPGNSRILFWLDDSYSLIQNCKNTNSSLGHSNQYFDYSFMITPAFKALELWIIQIAPALGVEENLVEGAKEYGRFNTFLNDEKIQELADVVIAKLETKAKAEKAIRASLTSLSSYLSTLRHTPAHSGSIIERPSQAETNFNEIVGAINRITGLLIDAKILDYKESNGTPKLATVWTKAPLL